MQSPLTLTFRCLCLLYYLIGIGTHKPDCFAVPSQDGEWKKGPSLYLGPNEEDVAIYHIPENEVYVDYREQPGAVKEGVAKLKVTYVKAGSQDAIKHMVADDRTFKRDGHFSSEIAEVVPLASLSMGYASVTKGKRKFSHESSHQCAAIVLYGKTKPKRGVVRRKTSKLAITIEVCLLDKSKVRHASHSTPTTQRTDSVADISPSPQPTLSPEEVQRAEKIHAEKLNSPTAYTETGDSLLLINKYTVDNQKLIDQVTGRDIIMIVGPAGVGKSLFINYLLGQKLIKQYPEVSGVPKLEKVLDLATSSLPGAPIIGHKKSPQTLQPTIIEDSGTHHIYCEYPGLGLVDERWPALSVATVISMQHMLKCARSVRFVILVNYETLRPQSHRARGLLDLPEIFTQLFGPTDDMERYKESLWVGIVRAPRDQELDHVRAWMGTALRMLEDRLFFYEPQDRGGHCFWNRATCRKKIHSLKATAYDGRLGHALLPQDHLAWLQTLLEDQQRNIRTYLSQYDYQEVATCWRHIRQLRKVEVYSIEHLLDSIQMSVCNHFNYLEALLAKACLDHDLQEAKCHLAHFQTAHDLFTEDLIWLDLPKVEVLHKYYCNAIEKPLQRQRDLAKLHAALQTHSRLANEELKQLQEALEEAREDDKQVEEAALIALDQEIKALEGLSSMQALRLKRELVLKRQFLRSQQDETKDKYAPLLDALRKTEESDNEALQALSVLLHDLKLTPDVLNSLELAHIDEEEQQARRHLAQEEEMRALRHRASIVIQSRFRVKKAYESVRYLRQIRVEESEALRREAERLRSTRRSISPPIRYNLTEEVGLISEVDVGTLLQEQAKRLYSEYRYNLRRYRDNIRYALSLRQMFGTDEWKKYTGFTVNRKRLPWNIQSILDAPCPFWQSKRVEDTHHLLLIPSGINLSRLSDSMKEGNADRLYTEFKLPLLDSAPRNTYWLLMTRNVLPNKRQLPLPSGYRMPSVLEAIMALMTRHRQFDNESFQYTSSDHTSKETETLSDLYNSLSKIVSEETLSSRFDGDVLIQQAKDALCRYTHLSADVDTELLHYINLFMSVTQCKASLEADEANYFVEMLYGGRQFAQGYLIASLTERNDDQHIACRVLS